MVRRETGPKGIKIELRGTWITGETKEGGARRQGEGGPRRKGDGEGEWGITMGTNGGW